MSISCCIITKNEEQNIASCINSVIDFVDEIILLDTGSTDKTIDICKSFSKVKIYTTIWEDNNAKARNKCLSYATSDWILFLDADERISKKTQNKFKDFMTNIEHTQNTIFQFKSINRNPYSLDKEYFKSSLFKNNLGIKYVGYNHDYPKLENTKVTYTLCHDMIILHDNGTTYNFLAEKHQKYIDRAIYILEQNIDSKNNYYYFKHLGDSYLFLKDIDKALDCYIKSENLAKEIENNKDFNLTLYLKIKKALLYDEKRYTLLKTYLDKIDLLMPNCLENKIHQGYINLILGNYTESLIYYNQALLISNDINSKIDINIGIGRVKLAIGNFDDSIKFFEYAYNLKPSDEICLHLVRAYFFSGYKNKCDFLLKKHGFDFSRLDIKKELSKYDIWSLKEKETLC